MKKSFSLSGSKCDEVVDVALFFHNNESRLRRVLTHSRERCGREGMRNGGQESLYFLFLWFIWPPTTQIVLPHVHWVLLNWIVK